MTTPLQITLHTKDGYLLAATHYPAPGDQFIVIASATGVPRGFYRRFAEFAQARGVNVVTTDYRGIGDSKPATLKGFDMQYADWSTLDLAAAVDYAATRGKAGAGWHGWMPRPERYRVWAMWHMLGPIGTRMYGYHPMSKFGGGEDLPMGVYRDWKRWCALPHYFFDDPEAKVITDKFAEVRIPIGAAVSTDDLWAPPASRDAFFKGYANAAVDAIDLQPEGLGVKQVGHMGYFRPQAGALLWPQILAWLAQYGLVQNKA